MLEEKSLHIIKNNLYLNIATVSDDSEPWNTPVYAVPNDKLIFYWRSWVGAQHSKNIRTNQSIFITIYDSSRELGTNNQKCVYIKAKAEEVSSLSEIESNLRLFANNILTADDFAGENVKRLYKAIPEKVWLNDLSEGQVDKDTVKMRVEVDLQKLKTLLMPKRT